MAAATTAQHRTARDAGAVRRAVVSAARGPRVTRPGTAHTGPRAHPWQARPPGHTAARRPRAEPGAVPLSVPVPPAAKEP